MNLLPGRGFVTHLMNGVIRYNKRNLQKGKD